MNHVSHSPAGPETAIPRRSRAALTGALLIAVTVLSGAIVGSHSAHATVVEANLVAQEGDAPPGGGGDLLTTLNAPFTNGDGVVGFTAILDDGGTSDHVVWFDSGVLWRNSDELVRSLSGAEGTMGISDAGGYVYSPSIDGDDGVWSHHGLLAVEGEPAPDFPPPATTTFHSRPTMTPDGTAYWIAGVAEDGGGGTDGRVLYTSPDAMSASISAVLAFGDFVDGLEIKSGSGVDFDYNLSDNGNHVHVLLLETGNIDTDGHVYVNGSTVAQEASPSGDGDNWDNFDAVSINDSGHYLLSGDTDGDGGSDEFIAYDAAIALREGETLAGVTLTSSGTVQALSLNNLGQAAFSWNYADGETLFFACDASDIRSSTTALLSVADDVDLDGDGSGDATITDLNASGVVGPGLSLGENGVIYAEVDLDYGAGELEATLELELPDCSGDLALAIAGTCPGALTATLSGATPNGNVAILRGSGPGSDAIPGGPCVGTPSDLADIALINLFTADANGDFELTRNVGGGVCGAFVQALDVDTCTTSNVANAP